MTDDFFRLPDGVEVKTATNHEEFTAVLKEIDAIRNPPPKRTFQPSPEHLAIEKKVNEDMARTSEDIRAEIEKKTKEASDAIIARHRQEWKAQGLPDPTEIGTGDGFERKSLEVKPFWTLRRTIAVIGNAILAALLIYFLWRKRVKK
jgi:hypothetical protein